jgi:hypothetical protein
MTTERIIQHCGWKTNGGGLLHRLNVPYRQKSICGIWITAMEMPYSEFEKMAKCKKCFPWQAG